MRQDELTSQMSEQIQKVVQNALREELAHFRLEQTKILREAVEEVLPEMEQRMFEKISGKSQVQDIRYSQRGPFFYPRSDIFPPAIIQVSFMEYHWSYVLLCSYVLQIPPPPKMIYKGYL